MSETRNLLIEIGTEELPPKALKRLSESFTKGIEEGLAKAELAHDAISSYATPRRLAVMIENLVTTQADKEVERRGPAVNAAFDEDGNPTKAAEGFARSCGTEVDQLETIETDKGAWLTFNIRQQGQATTAIIPGIVSESLDRLPIPKRMRWGSLKAEFVRPVHWLVLLFGDEVINAEILSVKSGRETRGHRFHHPEPIYLGEPEAYGPILESEGRVIADFNDRREAIRAQVMELASTIGGTAVIDNDLLDEVTALVEWPVAILGNFEERFLKVPAECLISAMKGHQKYFHLVDDAGRLMPNFVTLSNIESSDPDKVREGNERVIRPRLTDAEFFWNQDRKKRLEDHIEGLKTILFQKKLGSLYDKTERVTSLAGIIAETIGGDRSQAERAAQLAKCDLMCEMVYEFPELQGIMGRYYAQLDNESSEVAKALDEQYMPRFAGDQLPETRTGLALAIAEKLDTLMGIFAIGQPPTGDRDPFALRRATLGILRIIVEKGLDLDLFALLKQAAEGLSNVDLHPGENEINEVFDFMMERLRNIYYEQGIAPDTFESVLARRPSEPLDFDQRIHAVTAFRALPEAESLAAANKRISNILKKSDEPIPQSVDSEKLEESAEKALAIKINLLAAEVKPLLADRDYTEALKKLAALREPVDKFFDDVMVMAENAELRINRLALLSQLQGLFLQVADLSKLQG
jgi:glycyl-tRNA synthetase beta chain